MGRSLSNFEQSIKNSLEGVELPYDKDSWTELESKLSGSSKSFGRNWILAASFLALAAIGTFVVISSNTPVSGLMIKEYQSDSNVFLAEGVFTKMTNAESLDFVDNKVLDAYIADNEKAQNLQDLNADSNRDGQFDTSEAYMDQSNVFSDTNSGNLLNSESSKNNGNANNSNDSVDIANSSDDHSDSSSKDENTEKNDSSVPSISVSKSVACQGEVIDFAVSSGNIDGNYLWNFGNGDFADLPVATTVYSEPGFYKVSMSVTSNKDGQMRRIDISSNIEVLPSPKAIFDWEYVNAYAEAPSIKFVNTSSNAMESYWEFDNQFISNEISPIQEFKESGDHKVKLVVTNEYGCVDEFNDVITLKNDYNLLADKSFSPNNDGRNDLFIPNALRILDNDFTFSVFQDDELVFTSNNESEIKEWNGKLLDDKIAEIGSKFQWTVIVIDDNKEEQFYGGVITIVP